MKSIRARTFAIVALTLALAPAVAWQAGQRSGGSARWEYSILRLPVTRPKPVEAVEGGKVTKTYRYVVKVCVAQANGCQDRDVETTFAIVQDAGLTELEETNRFLDNALANAVAQLGAEGWEVVMQGDRLWPQVASLPPVLYFKRQVR